MAQISAKLVARDWYMPPEQAAGRPVYSSDLNSYSKREPGAYCAKASKNSNVSADSAAWRGSAIRFYAR